MGSGASSCENNLTGAILKERVYLIILENKILKNKILCDFIINEAFIEIRDPKKNTLIYPMPIHLLDLLVINSFDEIDSLFSKSQFSHAEIVELVIDVPKVISAQLITAINSLSSNKMKLHKKKIILSTIPNEMVKKRNFLKRIRFLWNEQLNKIGYSELYSNISTPEILDYYSNGIFNNLDMRDTIPYIDDLSIIIKENYSFKRLFFSNSSLLLLLIRQLEGYPVKTNIEVYIDYILSIYKLLFNSLINSSQTIESYNLLAYSETELLRIMEATIPKYIDIKQKYDEKKLIEIEIYQLLILKEIEEILRVNASENGNIKTISYLIIDKEFFTLRITQLFERTISYIHLTNPLNNCIFCVILVGQFLIYSFLKIFRYLVIKQNHNLVVHISRHCPSLFWTWMNKDYILEKLKDMNIVFQNQIKLMLKKLKENFTTVKLQSINNYPAFSNDGRTHDIVLQEYVEKSTLKSALVYKLFKEAPKEEVVKKTIKEDLETLLKSSELSILRIKDELNGITKD